jgi:NAD-dependent deacetylase
LSGTTDADNIDDGAVGVVAERLARASRVTVLTGAGVSAASGVPTFRGADGLWRQHRPEDLATPEAFARDPVLVWEWYDWRRQRVAACRPNAAHDVIARWSQARPGVTVVTQNVDGLHERAGTRDVVRLHGSIWHVRCWRGCSRGLPGRRLDDAPMATLPPRCPHCGGIERPGVVWFGEPLDDAMLELAMAAASHADLVLTVGTSSQVYPAAGLIPLAARAGAFVVEINPDATPFSSDVDAVLRAPAELALPLVDRALQALGRGGGAGSSTPTR